MGGGGSSLVSIDIGAGHPRCERTESEVPTQGEDDGQLNTLMV